MNGRTNLRRTLLLAALGLSLVPAAMTACGGSTSGAPETDGGTVPGPFGGEATDAGAVTEREFRCAVGSGVLDASIERTSAGDRLHLTGFQFTPGSQIAVSADFNGDGVPDQSLTGVADASGHVDAAAVLPGGTDLSQVNIGSGLCAFTEVTVDGGTPAADAGAVTPPGSTGAASDAGTFFTPAPAAGPHP